MVPGATPVCTGLLPEYRKLKDRSPTLGTAGGMELHGHGFGAGAVVGRVSAGVDGEPGDDVDVGGLVPAPAASPPDGPEDPLEPPQPVSAVASSSRSHSSEMNDATIWGRQ